MLKLNEGKKHAFMVNHYREALEMAKRDRAGREFISGVRRLVPKDEECLLILNEMGFDSLRHLITDPVGLQLDEETFVKLAFAFKSYNHKAEEVIRYLVTQEGWTELLKHVDAEHRVACGESLGANARPKKCDNITLNKDDERGTSKAYTLKKLERDAAKDERTAKLYELVKAKKMSAHKAAVELGWRPKTITIRQDVESAARSIRKLFCDEDVKELAKLLKG